MKKAGNSLSSQNGRSLRAGTGASPVSPTIKLKTKLWKQLRLLDSSISILDNHIFQLRTLVMYGYDLKGYNRLQAKKLKRNKLDLKRKETRNKLKELGKNL